MLQNRHATCGKYKDEMIRQLRGLSRSEPGCLKFETPDAEIDAGFQFLAPDLFSTCELVIETAIGCVFLCLSNDFPAYKSLLSI